MRREFEKAVHAGQFIVVKGETGSGKSTQLPQYLADMRGIDGQVSSSIWA
jgi:HrpA-like RNA helicase